MSYTLILGTNLADFCDCVRKVVPNVSAKYPNCVIFYSKFYKHKSKNMKFEIKREF